MNLKVIRRLLFILLTFICFASATAREPERGYRGFVDANADLSFYHDYYYDSSVVTYYGISTSHGYQFNSHLFLGVGVMSEHIHDGYRSFNGFPVYLHARTDWRFGRFPVYGDVRIGGVIFGEYRLYLSPTVGYRLSLGRKCNLNFGIGMNFRGYGWSDTKTLHPQLAFRFGIDF